MSLSAVTLFVILQENKINFGISLKNWLRKNQNEKKRHDQNNTK